MKTMTTLGRVLFATPFAIFGLFHFLGGSQMAGMVPLPGGIYWVYFTGVALIAASVAILTQKLGKWAAMGLAVMLVGFVAMVHVPMLADPAMRQMAMISLLKDVSLAGAALTWAGVFAARERRAGAYDDNDEVVGGHAHSMP